MKLRNKKTGEIVIFGEGIVDLNQIGCKNVVEMIEAGWEDYEEPKEYWWISPVNTDVVHWVDVGDKKDGYNKQIGNYFETKEEAEKAVEKLKAWKRLKDKGFKFGRWQFLDDRSGVWVRGNYVPDIVDELDILFGGEE